MMKDVLGGGFKKFSFSPIPGEMIIFFRWVETTNYCQLEFVEILQFEEFFPEILSCFFFFSSQKIPGVNLKIHVFFSAHQLVVQVGSGT